MGTCCEQKHMIFLREGCFNFASLMSTQLFSREHHNPLVLLPAEQRKVVTTSASQNKYGLEIFLSLISRNLESS